MIRLLLFAHHSHNNLCEVSVFFPTDAERSAARRAFLAEERRWPGFDAPLKLADETTRHLIGEL